MNFACTRLWWFVFIGLIPWISFGVDQAPEWRPEHQVRLVELFGDRAALRYRAWRKLLVEAEDLPDEQKLEQVNQFFNQFLFADDQRLWGQSNYWATPMEFIGIAAGDCEDFALAKFISLQLLGVDPEKLRLVYVKATSLNQFHMVTAYYPEPTAIPLVLDNIDGRIVSADKRPDLKPIFSFDGQRIWLAGPRASNKPINRPALDSWSQFNHRRQTGIMNRPPRTLGD